MKKSRGSFLSLLHKCGANSHPFMCILSFISVSFWSDFTGWYHCISKETLTLGRKEIMYGILNNWSFCSALNHLILISKYLIYCKAISRVNFLFADFKALLHQKIEIEKYIAFSSNKCSTFYEKWVRFLN